MQGNINLRTMTPSGGVALRQTSIMAFHFNKVNSKFPTMVMHNIISSTSKIMVDGLYMLHRNTNNGLWDHVVG